MSERIVDRDGRFLLGLALAVGMIGSTALAGRALLKTRTDTSIQVTGSAKRRIRSDLVVWSAQVSAQAADRTAAYRALAQATPKLLSWLEQKGLPRDRLVTSAVAITIHHPSDKEGRSIEDVVSGYTLSQAVEVRSGDVDLVTRVAREVTQLLEQGLDISSSAPSYHYTKLGDLKIQMLAEAAKDSRVRAEQIARSTGSSIGPLRSARMGVIQINPADSTETSNEGNNDTSSLEKDIISVVQSTFALE